MIGKKQLNNTERKNMNRNILTSYTRQNNKLEAFYNKFKISPYGILVLKHLNINNETEFINRRYTIHGILVDAKIREI